jgi:DNA polymerase III subunit beta
MQLIKANRDAILKPLQVVSGIVERRHTLPILANILITKKADQVSFLGTDIEIQIQTKASLSSGTDQAATTVSARKLLDILRALPEAEVTLNLTNKRLSIQSGKSRFALQTLAAEEFPTVSIAEQFGAKFSLSQKKLKELLHMVHFAMAQQDIRYYLNGLLFVVEGSDVRVVATDGHRLAYCSATLPEPVVSSTGKQEVIIPRKSIIELQRLLEDTEEPVLIEVASNQIRFSFGSIEMVSKLVEGKFPDYQRVIPTGYTKETTVDREVLSKSLQRVAILTSEKLKAVRFNISESALKIQASNAEQEEAIEELDIEYNGEALEVGFNVSYLLDVLSNLKTNQVKLSFGDTNSSALLTVPGDDSFKYVVMPMRI